MNNKKKAFDPAPYVKEGVTAEEVQEIKEAFDLFDTENNGYIDAKVSPHSGTKNCHEILGI